MSVPIGSIEFLVNFDTMSSEFKDALKDALEKADISFPEEVKNDIKTIKYNIQNRLRGLFTRDRLQYLATAPPEIKATQTKEFIGEIQKVLMGSPTGKRLFPVKPDEKPEEYLARMEKTAKTLANRYGEFLVKAFKDEDFFNKEIGKIIALQSAHQDALKGDHQHLVQKIMEMLLTEKKDWEVIMKDKLEGLGIEFSKEQKKWAYTKEEIGKGETLIESTDQLIEEIQKMNLTKEQFKSIFFGVDAVKGIDEKLKKFFEVDFRIAAGLPVLRPILKAIEKIDYTQEEQLDELGNVIETDEEEEPEKILEHEQVEWMGGMMTDIGMILEKDWWDIEENKENFLEMIDSPEMRKQFQDVADEIFETSKFAWYSIEGKRIMSWTEAMKKQQRLYAIKQGILSQMGGSAGIGQVEMTTDIPGAEEPIPEAKEIIDEQQAQIIEFSKKILDAVKDVTGSLDAMQSDEAQFMLAQFLAALSKIKGGS